MSAQVDPRERDADAGAERALLGGLIALPKKIPEVANLVAHTDFAVRGHAALFETLLDMDTAGLAVDTLTLATELRRRGQLELVGGMGFLASLDSAAPAASNAPTYARMVAEAGALRRIVGTLSGALMQAARGEGTSAELLAQLEHEILALDSVRPGGDLTQMQGFLDRCLALLDSMRNQPGGVTGLHTGLDALDRQLSGLHGGELIILAARPGCGKSALSLQFALNCALVEKKACGFFSLEMPGDQLALRALANAGKVSLKRLREGGLSELDLSRINEAASKLWEAPLYLDDTAGITLSELRSRARRLKVKRPDLALLVVDYLQIMGTEGGDSREQAVAALSRGLKQLARDLSVPVVALSQLNRKVEERKSGRPQLSDLRESGSLEQEADVVMFLSPEQDEDDEAARGTTPVELIVAKQRNGPTGDIPLTLLQEFTRFEPREVRAEESRR